MDEQRAGRFEVLVEEGPPHGDLYELEQTTHYRVVDTHLKEVVLTFQGEMEASLSTTTGMWDDHCFYGVCGVAIAPDEESVIVKYYDGREEAVLLPQ
jgi:hypothetical protein